jgi:nicotinamide riboside transporter PnuC
MEVRCTCPEKGKIFTVQKELLMKKFNWIKSLLFNIITCSIYSLYMWYKMAKQQNEMAEQVGAKKIMGFIPAFLLGCVTCGIFNIVWFFLFMKQQAAVAEAKGVALAPTSSPIVLTILVFVPIYSFYVICDNCNKLVDAYEA